MASVWSRLSTHLVKMNHDTKERMTSSTLVISSNRSRTADAQSEAYENAALAHHSKKLAQRAVISAPWRLSAWQAL